MCVNLGKNKTSSDANNDYAKGIECFAPLADFLVINISSPNTPGLRDMQGKRAFSKLIDSVMDARERIKSPKKIPVLVKIAPHPDLTYDDCKDIVEVIKLKVGK